MLRITLFAILSLFGLIPVRGSDVVSKPRMTLAKDGFPVGTDTPEGAACNLARAFINRDASLFRSTCIAPYGGADTEKAYQEFLDGVTSQMKLEAAKTAPSPNGPKSINKCFAARHLSRNGPSSYGYAAFGFQDVMFVDVDVVTNSGKAQLCRTLVIKDEQGQWIVHPRPDLSPLLSEGLNDEPPSKTDFSEKYLTK